MSIRLTTTFIDKTPIRAEICLQLSTSTFDHWVERENIGVNIFIPMLIAFGIYDRATHESEQVAISSIWLPEFAKFRQSPQFKELVSEYDMLTFWQSNGFPPQCRPIGDQYFECD
jgi:hypothetical protein